MTPLRWHRADEPGRPLQAFHPRDPSWRVRLSTQRNLRGNFPWSVSQWRAGVWVDVRTDEKRRRCDARAEATGALTEAMAQGRAA